MNDQIQEAVIDKIKTSDDRVIEIRPVDKSKGRRKFPLMVIIGGALALSYWLQKSRPPTETLQNAVSEAADRTKKATEKTAGTIEEGSEQASDTVEQFGKEAADKTERAGKEAADKAEKAGEKASDKADESGRSSTGKPSSS